MGSIQTNKKNRRCEPWCLCAFVAFERRFFNSLLGLHHPPDTIIEGPLGSEFKKVETCVCFFIQVLEEQSPEFSPQLQSLPYSLVVVKQIRELLAVPLRWKKIVIGYNGATPKDITCYKIYIFQLRINQIPLKCFWREGGDIRLIWQFFLGFPIPP